MSREEIIDRLQSLSDAEFARVAPFFEADLESVDDEDALRREVELGRLSARTEPLVDDDAVHARVAARLAQLS